MGVTSHSHRSFSTVANTLDLVLYLCMFPSDVRPIPPKRREDATDSPNELCLVYDGLDLTTSS